MRWWPRATVGADGRSWVESDVERSSSTSAQNAVAKRDDLIALPSTWVVARIAARTT